MINRIYIGETEISSVKFGNGFALNLFRPHTQTLNLDNTDVMLTGTWLNSSLTGFDGTPTKYSSTTGDSAKYNFYLDVTGNFNIYVWYPENINNPSSVKYTATSIDGTWLFDIDQKVNGGMWNKIGTVSGDVGTALSVEIKVEEQNTRVNAVMIERTLSAIDPIYDSGGNQDTSSVFAFVNQSGYDLNKPKRATVTNVANGTPFQIKRVNDGTVAFEGTVTNQIADFSSFNPSTSEEFYLQCLDKASYNFSIGKYLMQKVSINPALRFMDESRQDTFNVGGSTGYGWRDSHQFSFELNSLAMQYMANPSVYERMPYGISNLETCEYTELRIQSEPDIIWLMKFGAKRYWDLKVNEGKNLHALIKGQLAYFLFVYPEISQYVSNEFYTQIRDLAIQEWSNPNCNLQWYETSNGTDNNLFAVQNVIGGIKGTKPPGYAIVPNLLMYEVAKRDGLANYQDFFDAAYNNCEWLVNSVNLDDPQYTKGQRMSEWITIDGLTYFQYTYPLQAPIGLLDKINRWTDVMIARSNNMWDLRKYADPNDGTGTLNQWTGGLEQYNEVGNVAGFQAIALAASRVINDETKKNRLKEIGIAQIDNVFGRNPFGRHYSYDAPTQIEGVDLGWFTYYIGGYGDLGNVAGVLDGAPKESAYPFNPSAPYGYTEGWVAFNTAWNASLAYSAADDVELFIFDSAFANEISLISANGTIGIRLKAPLNFDKATIETGEVLVTTSAGEKINVTVTEESEDGFYFSTTYTIPSDVTYIDVSYGIGLFKKEKRINVILN